MLHLVPGSIIVGFGLLGFEWAILSTLELDRSKSSILFPGPLLPEVRPKKKALPGYGIQLLAEYHTQWILSILRDCLATTGTVTSVLFIHTYLVDSFPLDAGSVTVIGKVLGRLGGELVRLAGPAVYGQCGYGWGNTIFALIALAILPVTLYLFLH